MCVSNFDALRQRVKQTVMYTAGVIVVFSVIGFSVSTIVERDWSQYLSDNFGLAAEREFGGGSGLYPQMGIFFMLLGICLNSIIPYCGYRAQKTGNCACCYCSCTLVSLIACLLSCLWLLGTSELIFGAQELVKECAPQTHCCGAAIDVECDATTGLPVEGAGAMMKKRYLECILVAHPAYKVEGDDTTVLRHKSARLPHVCIPALVGLVRCDDFPPRIDDMDWNDFDTRVWPGSEDQKLAKPALLERDWHRFQRELERPGAVSRMGSVGVLALAAQQAHKNLQHVKSATLHLPDQPYNVDTPPNEWTPAAVQAWAAAGPLKDRDFPYFFRLWGVTAKELRDSHFTANNVTQYTAGVNLGLHEGNVSDYFTEQSILEGSVYGKRVWRELLHPKNGLKNCVLQPKNATALNQLSSVVLRDAQITQSWAGWYSVVESIVLLFAFVYGVQLWWRVDEFRFVGLIDAGYGQPLVVGGAVQGGNPPPTNPAALV